ncbi:LytTR family DNA-binding domain-containing protein [Caulobacter sp. BP25]|uniref:LytTR family DNA-binding domain-containing protein n=1 Tax=Caulobacter sp. BP25 TaxID=2048900 RepID=UPI000C12B9D6|nr:LytTR family DNA-binding domain-containing protein [Caulobacter sp. BP25]PHY17236.1 histidine kinase [Caulobacter sp. BP25]
MTLKDRPAALRRLTIDLLLLTALGLVLGVLSPFGTARLPPGDRFGYWLLSIVGGGMLGVAVDELLGRRIDHFARRLLTVTTVMTPAVVVWVGLVEMMFGHQSFWLPPVLWFRVWVISGLVMAVRILAWRKPVAPPPIVETRLVVASPLPEAEAAFRQRLSAKRRTAQLIAVEAHDHYLRVHTDAGPELLTLRFSDALAELAGVHGFQTHRSWWVAADAIEAAHWRRGSGELRLAGGVVAPVSRRHVSVLRAAGWL